MLLEIKLYPASKLLEIPKDKINEYASTFNNTVDYGYGITEREYVLDVIDHFYHYVYDYTTSCGNLLELKIHSIIDDYLLCQVIEAGKEETHDIIDGLLNHVFINPTNQKDEEEMSETWDNINLVSGSLTYDIEKIAQEEVAYNIKDNTLFVFGSEIATLKLFRAYAHENKSANQGIHEVLGCYFFSLALEPLKFDN